MAAPRRPPRFIVRTFRSAKALCQNAREQEVFFVNLRPALLVLAILGLAAPASAQLNQPIYPAYDGFLANPDGSYTLAFAYFSHNAETVTVAAGAQNSFSPSPLDRQQPITFKPGHWRFQCVMVVGPDFDGKLRWTLTYGGVTTGTSEHMIITKSELLASLQKEVRILLHLASKIDRSQLDYRPTPKQRSTIELLQYLSYMTIRHDLRQALGLIAPLEDRGAEVDVIDVQRVAADRNVRALQASLLAGLPRQIVLGVMDDWQAAQDRVAKLMAAPFARRRHAMTAAKRRPWDEGVHRRMLPEHRA